MQSDEVILNVIIDKIIYYNQHSDYTVCKVKTEDGDICTAVGHLGGIQPGENFQIQCTWVVDPKYGEQLKVNKYRLVLPSSKQGIINFLSSKLIHGIGKKYAEKIYNQFGDETLNIISNNPDRLNEVPLLGKKRIESMLKSWKENYAVRDIMMFLQNYNLTCSFAWKIFKQYGFDSIAIVKENPYRLASEVSGIGFISADKLANSMGIAKDSTQRLEAGIIYVLWQKTESGHVYLPKEFLLNETNKILDVAKDKIENSLQILINSNKIVETLSNNNSCIYLKPLFEAENELVQHFKRILKGTSKLMVENPDLLVYEAEKESSMEFSKAQKEAILLSCKTKALVITGGPGTGKTTIIKALTEIIKHHQLKVLLAAPTGRAAKRLSESTHMEAKTIHRLLEYKPFEQRYDFLKNQDNPLIADVIIIDEASMIDLLLMHHLIKAIPDHAVFIMVGDVDQLPSVGPGAILKDVIDSTKIPTIKLDTIFRQAKGSLIIENAHHINNSEPLSMNNSVDDNFFFIQKNTPEEIVSVILELVCKRIPDKFGFDPLKDIQVLSPMHRTESGVSNLNLKLQERLNPNNKISVRRHLNIAKNDKVMQISNNYEKEIYNGDIGFIEDIDEENQIVLIKFDLRVVKLTYIECDDIVLAYATTIHKSQGSEYNAVIIPLSTQHYTMLQKNLIYTAVTRGKKLVVLVGTKKALAIAVNNRNTEERFSNLKHKLLEKLD